MKFVVGWPSEDEQIFNLLLDEFAQFDDLIFYDIEDTYANLYLKVFIHLFSILNILCFRYLWHFNGNNFIVQMPNLYSKRTMTLVWIWAASNGGLPMNLCIASTSIRHQFLVEFGEAQRQSDYLLIDGQFLIKCQFNNINLGMSHPASTQNPNILLT